MKLKKEMMERLTLWRKLAAPNIHRYLLVRNQWFKVRQQDLQSLFGNYDKQLSIEEAARLYQFEFTESLENRVQKFNFYSKEEASL